LVKTPESLIWDPQKAKRAMEAMLKMKKIDIEGLRKAYQGSTLEA